MEKAYLLVDEQCDYMITESEDIWNIDAKLWWSWMMLWLFDIFLLSMGTV